MSGYARRVTRPKPVKSASHQWLAPSSGWISNRLLASPDSIEGPGAAVLDNFFPRATGVQLRRGKELYATFEDLGLNVTSLFTYHNGLNERMFGANETTIYDLSNVFFPEGGVLVDGDEDEIATEDGDVFGWSSTDGLDVMTGYTGGDWSVVQFSPTGGGVYLIGVNGEDTGFIYDGTTFYPYIEGGVYRLNYDAETDAFLDGELVTGGTSGATGMIFRAVAGLVPGTGYLLLTGVTDTFQDNEAITGATAGSATADGAAVLAVPGADFGTLTSADMSFVWAYKNRLWFIQKNSLDAWYMDIDQIGGEATLFPMGGVFSDGGALMFGARWSMGSSGEGGLSDQNTFFTTAGQVAVYQGDRPEDAATWGIVGVYRTGAPMGKRAYIRGGGDIAVATDIGLVPLSKAIELDITALNVATVSYKIADAWSEAVRQRGSSNWQAYIWSQEKMAVIAPPNLIGSSFPVIFVTNTETGAWARYTNWMAHCFTVYRGELYFGSDNGEVFKANVGGLDDGLPYTGTVVNLFDDMGAPASAKIGKMVRPVTRSNYSVNDQAAILTNYTSTLPTPPNATAAVGDNTWGSGVWGTAVWGSVTPTVITGDWRSAGGIGHVLAPCYQVTSGSLAPADVQLLSIDTTHTQATLVT